MDQNDSELVRRSLGGDHEAFAVIYDRYARLVRAVCFEATGNTPDAQEGAQEAFVRAWQRLDTLEDAERLGAWLIGIARHVCREWRRSKRKTCEAVDEQACVQPVDREGEDRRHLLVQLFDVLGELSDQERTAIHLFYLEERPAQQARSVLGLSTSGFYRVLDRARKRLAQMMKRKEGCGDERTLR